MRIETALGAFLEFTHYLDRETAMPTVSRFHVEISTAKSSTGVLDPPLKPPLGGFFCALNCLIGL